MIQPHVESEVNRWLVPFGLLLEQNQPMVKKAQDVSPIGRVIKEALLALDPPRTQGWLAEELGVSNNAVSKWIKGGQIGRENLGPLSKAIHVSAGKLLNAEEFGRLAEEIDDPLIAEVVDLWNYLNPKAQEKMLVEMREAKEDFHLVTKRHSDRMPVGPRKPEKQPSKLKIVERKHPR